MLWEEAIDQVWYAGQGTQEFEEHVATDAAHQRLPSPIKPQKLGDFPIMEMGSRTGGSRREPTEYHMLR